MTVKVDPSAASLHVPAMNSCVGTSGTGGAPVRSEAIVLIVRSYRRSNVICVNEPIGTARRSVRLAPFLEARHGVLLVRPGLLLELAGGGSRRDHLDDL